MVRVEFVREQAIYKGTVRRDCSLLDELDGLEWDILDADVVIPPFDTHPNCKCYLRDVKTGEKWLS